MAILDNTIVEERETVMVQLDSVTSSDPAISIDTGADTATVTIVDNDTATVCIAKASDAGETGDGGQFTVTQSTTSSTDTVVSYTVSRQHGDRGGVDYTTRRRTVTILAGQTTAVIDVAGIVTTRSSRPARRWW